MQIPWDDFAACTKNSRLGRVAVRERTPIVRKKTGFKYKGALTKKGNWSH